MENAVPDRDMDMEEALYVWGLYMYMETIVSSVLAHHRCYQLKFEGSQV